MAGYVPKLTSERIELLRRWHEEASAELHEIGAHDVEYLGLQLHVPARCSRRRLHRTSWDARSSPECSQDTECWTWAVEPERTQSSPHR